MTETTSWQHKPAPHIQTAERVTTNTHVLACIEHATLCVRWLHEQGYTVLTVIAGQRNPRIEIAATRHCAQLKGVVRMTERHYNQPTRHSWVAFLFGCEVRWSESEVQ